MKADDLALDMFRRQQAELSSEEARRLQDSFRHQPLISVIMPVYKTPEQWLRRAVEIAAGAALRTLGALRRR